MDARIRSRLLGGGGLVLLSGGVCMALISAGLSPFLPIDASFATSPRPSFWVLGGFCWAGSCAAWRKPKPRPDNGGR